MGCPFRNCPDLKCRIALFLRALLQKSPSCREDFGGCPVFHGKVELSLRDVAPPIRFAS